MHVLHFTILISWNFFRELKLVPNVRQSEIWVQDNLVAGFSLTSTAFPSFKSKALCRKLKGNLKLL